MLAWWTVYYPWQVCQNAHRKYKLHYAALCGSSCAIKQLVVTRGQDIDVQCGWHNTPMCLVLTKCCLGVECFLLEHGSDVDAENLRGELSPATADLFQGWWCGGNALVMILEQMRTCAAVMARHRCTKWPSNDDTRSSYSSTTQTPTPSTVMVHTSSYEASKKERWSRTELALRTPLRCASGKGKLEVV